MQALTEENIRKDLGKCDLKKLLQEYGHIAMSEATRDGLLQHLHKIPKEIEPKIYEYYLTNISKLLFLRSKSDEEQKKLLANGIKELKKVYNDEIKTFERNEQSKELSTMENLINNI